MNEIQFKYQFETIGEIYFSANEKALTAALWQIDPSLELWTGSLDQSTPAHAIILKSIEQIHEYLNGEREEFQIPIEFNRGTPFQQKVWQTLQSIPFGQTCSYQDLANDLENPKAVRAIGSANGKNPISILVPCHRVIGKNGKLTGYAGGLKAKEHLLKVEGIICKP
jgi:methylated-DNA-[protein]-cysteine S-methyltransferase